MNPNKYIIQIGESHWIKETAKFGPFHGRIAVTDDKGQARRFTRQKDAASLAKVFNWRVREYEQDKKHAPLGTAVEKLLD